MAGKRGQNEGSIYQDRHGQWWAAISLPNGKRKAARCADRKAAQAKLKAWHDLTAQSIPLDAGAQSLEAFLNAWFRESVQDNLAPGTQEFYKGYCERYLIPSLGRYALDTLVSNPRLIQTMLNECRDSGLSPRTIKHVWTVLHTALERAVKWNNIAANPCSRIDPPKVPRTRKQELSPSQCAALFVAVQEHRLATLYHAAPILGCRLGELLGWRWADLKWAKAEISITQQVQVVSGKLVIRKLKTDASSARTIPIPPRLLERLRSDWQTRQEERRLLGARWHEHGLVWPSKLGTPKAPRNLERDWYGFRATAGIPERVNFHMLRHTCASFAAEAGTNEAIIGALLGHASGRTITGHYTHATKAALRRCVHDIERLVYGDEANEIRRIG